jgi:dihydroorotase
VLGPSAAGGRIAVGAPADLCVFDPEEHWTVAPEALASQGRHTPYLGMELSGRARFTVVDGRVAFER